jgi:hypothetical protein
VTLGTVPTGFPRGLAVFCLSGSLIVGTISWFGASRLRAASRSPSKEQPSTTVEKSFTCPRASWRLADRSELRQSLLSLSHILIRHKQSQPRIVALSALSWETEMQLQPRTRDDALARAFQLKAKLESAQNSWGDLVREYSDDPVTREDEGRLGVFPASEFLLWPNILDCLAPMQEGGYAIAESASGIHLFRRDSAPEVEAFAAQRIVIGYRDAGFLRYVARAEVPQRSRAEALALAEAIRKRALNEDFGALVERYSEHRDFTRGGDIGAWSTREPTNFPRLLDAIVRTPLGKLTRVLDSELGFQIFLRTPATERPQFAMDSARFAFESGTTEEARRSRDAALAEALVYLDAWRSGGKRPTDERYRQNEAPREVWSSGRGPDGAEMALREVPVGALLPEPIQSDVSYLVARRVEPPRSEQRAARVWLPEPTEPDIAHFVATFSDQSVERLLVAAEGDTEPAVCSECQRLRRALLAELKVSTTASARRLAWFTFRQGLEAALSPAAAQTYQGSLRRRLRDRLLRARSR